MVNRAAARSWTGVTRLRASSRSRGPAGASGRLPDVLDKLACSGNYDPRSDHQAEPLNPRTPFGS